CSPDLHIRYITTTHCTGGRPSANIRQLRPSSADRKTSPVEVPNAAHEPDAARQAVSMLSENHSGRPCWHRSKGPSPHTGLRHTAARFVNGPVEAATR